MVIITTKGFFYTVFYDPAVGRSSENGFFRRSTYRVVKHSVKEANWSFRCDCDVSPRSLPLRHCLFGGLSFSSEIMIIKIVFEEGVMHWHRSQDYSLFFDLTTNAYVEVMTVHVSVLKAPKSKCLLFSVSRLLHFIRLYMTWSSVSSKWSNPPKTGSCVWVRYLEGLGVGWSKFFSQLHMKTGCTRVRIASFLPRLHLSVVKTGQPSGISCASSLYVRVMA